MSIRKLPELDLKPSAEMLRLFSDKEKRAAQFMPDGPAMDQWKPGIRMEDGADDNVVSVLGIVGEDWLFDGVTAKAVLARLKQIGKRDVVVNVNSPGGDFFEGQAIYNALRLHPAQVTVRVLGIAASAASVVAMAGDRIEMSGASWMMIHNVHVVDDGDRHYKRAIADTMEMFDDASARLYADRSGTGIREIKTMMDDETVMGGDDAVKKGFADALVDFDKVKEDAKSAASVAQRIDAALKRDGLTRAARRELVSQFLAVKLRAGGGGTPRAADLPAITPETLTNLRAAIAALP